MVASLYIDKDETLWVSATGEGVYSYRFDTGKLTHYAHNPSIPNTLSNNNVNNIMQDSNGNLWIVKPREKTNNLCNIPLLSIPKQILEKYKDNPYCMDKGTLLPVPCNQKMNSYLKEIADLCGIKKNLTTHTARHSFASVIALASNVSLPNVAKMLGHSSTRMTQHYAKVLDQTILMDMQAVEKQLSV